MPPRPVAGHKITVSAFAILKVTVGNIVDVVDQIRVCENVVDDLPRVSVPELVLRGHPLRGGPIVWAESIILDGI